MDRNVLIAEIGEVYSAFGKQIGKVRNIGIQAGYVLGILALNDDLVGELKLHEGVEMVDVTKLFAGMGQRIEDLGLPADQHFAAAMFAQALGGIADETVCFGEKTGAEIVRVLSWQARRADRSKHWDVVAEMPVVQAGIKRLRHDAIALAQRAPQHQVSRPVVAPDEYPGD